MYIKSLEINNLRCFEQEKFEFKYPGCSSDSDRSPNINIFLGENGSGKTTLMQSLAIGCLGNMLNFGAVNAPGFVRDVQGVNKGTIKSELLFQPQDWPNLPTEVSHTLETTIIKSDSSDFLDISKWDIVSGILNYALLDKSPSFLVMGYGVTRVGEPVKVRKKGVSSRYQRIATLFEKHNSAVPMSAWFPSRARKDTIDPVLRILNDLLVNRKLKFVLSKGGSELVYQQGKFEFPIASLSGGYRSLFTWVGDLIYHLHEVSRSGNSIEDLKGIVLVDEIDLHIHPEWQIDLMETISKTFKNLQFIFSTHSPILAGTVDSKSLIVAEYDEEKQSSKASHFTHDIYGLNANQILLSSYFGLRSTRARGQIDELHRLAMRVWDHDPNAAIEFFQAMSGSNRDKSNNQNNE